MYLRDPVLPLQVVLNHVPSLYVDSSEDYKLRVLNNFSNAWKLAREQIKISQQKQKKYYDCKVNVPEFKVGDRVLLFHPAVSVGKTRKLACRYVGPYRIQSLEFKPVVLITSISKPRVEPLRVHINRLKPFVSQTEALETTTGPVGKEKRKNATVVEVGIKPQTNLRYNLRPRNT